MKLANVFSWKSFVLILALLGTFTRPSFATMDTIDFGGSLGLVFKPSALNVHVGDTIVWIGSYAFHQIQSTSIPAGAPTFGPTVVSASTQPLTYVVTVPGVFNYQCNIHFSMGMIGSFTAATAGVDEPVSNDQATLGINYPNPFTGITILRYTVNHTSQIDLKIFDLNGKVLAQVVNKYQPADSYEVPFDASNLPNGTYICELKCGDAILTRRIILAK
jgi:plastocyanin